MKSKQMLLLMLAALYTALFKITCIPTLVQQGLKLLAVAFVLIGLVANKKNVDLRQPIFIFGVGIVVSTVYATLNRYVDIIDLMDSILYAVVIYEMSLLITTLFRMGYGRDAIGVCLSMTVIYCICSIVSIVIVGVSSESLLYYFAGNKFATSYMFIFFAGLLYAWMSILGEREWKAKVAAAIALLISSTVAGMLCCTTALVASLSAVVFLFIPKKIGNFLARPAILVSLFALSGALLCVLQDIISLPLISGFVIDVLGETPSLTGREGIYAALPGIILKSPILGYGYGNHAIAKVVGYGNAQNSVMEIVVNYGIVGLGCLLVVMWSAFKRVDQGWKRGFLIVVGALMVASIVEISVNYYFLISLVFLDTKHKVSPIVDKRAQRMSQMVSGSVLGDV